MSDVLVLTNSEDDPNSSSVIEKVLYQGHSVVRMDIDCITNGTHRLTLNYHGATRMIYETGKMSYQLDDVDSVWFRRPYSFDFCIEDPVQLAVAEEEVRDVLDGAWQLLEAKYWVSSATSIRRARLKPLQMAYAQRFGFVVPESIITNDPDQARQFCAGGKTVFKPMIGHYFDYGTEARTAYTTVLNSGHLEQLHMITNQAVLLQRWVEKAYELKVVYVGGRLFPVKIMANDYSRVEDWKIPEEFGKLMYEPYVLSVEDEQRILQYVRAYDLEYAVVDLMRSTSGGLYFLEINPVGQWLWLEEETGLPISQAIADCLTSRCKEVK
ncbi:hypothetical protein KBC99_00555 [Candidatus Saccharibacteria bacterium]|nr:hypothetical protein [Candidatus Saccharibacteria bacterium]